MTTIQTYTIPVNGQIEISPLLETDKPSIVKYINEREIYDNTLVIPHPYTMEDAIFYMNLVKETETKNEKQSHWAIRQQGEMIGGIGLLYNHGINSHKSEIGYWIGKQFWGQGIMTQVVKSFSHFCFETYQMQRLEATIFKHNAGSMRVAVKAGFVREGLLRKAYFKDGEYLDGVLHSLVV